MTNNLNQITLVGRLGQEPAVRYFESGTVLTRLTLAVKRRRRDESPDWFDVECWDKIAEITGQYTTKGSLIGITGELKLDEWQDKETGEARYKPVVRAQSLQLLERRPTEEDSQEDF